MFVKRPYLKPDRTIDWRMIPVCQCTFAQRGRAGECCGSCGCGIAAECEILYESRWPYEYYTSAKAKSKQGEA